MMTQKKEKATFKQIDLVEIEQPQADPDQQAPAEDADSYQMMQPGQEVEAVVVSVSEVEMFHHDKFGDKPFVTVGVEFDGTQQELKLFLPRNKMIRPNSTTGKLFKACKVNKLSGLIGKKILLKTNKDGYLRFAVEEF